MSNIVHLISFLISWYLKRLLYSFLLLITYVIHSSINKTNDYYLFSPLKISQPEAALRLLGKATTAPSRKVDYYDRSEPVQARLHKSLRLWSLYTDLEESFGTFETTKVNTDYFFIIQII